VCRADRNENQNPYLKPQAKYISKLFGFANFVDASTSGFRNELDNNKGISSAIVVAFRSAAVLTV